MRENIDLPDAHVQLCERPVTFSTKRIIDRLKDRARALIDFLLRPVYSYFWWRGYIHKGDQPLPKLTEARSILVIRPDEIGDFILMSPFLRELRRNAPQAKITLLIKKSIFAMAEFCPYVDEILIYDWEKHSGRPFFPLWFRMEAVRTARKFFKTNHPGIILLPRRDYDAFETELLAHAAASRSPVAKSRSESSYYTGYQKFFPRCGHVFENSAREHEVTHSLHFLKWLGGTIQDDHLEVWPAPQDEVFADDFFARHQLKPGATLVLHPSGGRSHLKQWPRERFVELLASLQKSVPTLSCLVIGGPDEGWVRELFPSSPAPHIVTAVGEFKLRQLAAILKRAGLFLGGDSGPMHMAAAAGIPVVALFGSTHLQRYRPYSPWAEVVTLEKSCSPAQVGSLLDRCWRCVHPENICLTEISVEMVAERALPIIQKLPR